MPKDIINSMYLNQNYQFEVFEDKGKIVLVPVAIYPEHVIKNLKAEVDEIKESIKNVSRQPLIQSILYLKSL